MRRGHHLHFRRICILMAADTPLVLLKNCLLIGRLHLMGFVAVAATQQIAVMAFDKGGFDGAEFFLDFLMAIKTGQQSA